VLRSIPSSRASRRAAGPATREVGKWIGLRLVAGATGAAFEMRSDEVDEEEVVGEVNDEAGASGWAVNEETNRF